MKEWVRRKVKCAVSTTHHEHSANHRMKAVAAAVMRIVVIVVIVVMMTEEIQGGVAALSFIKMRKTTHRGLVIVHTQPKKDIIINNINPVMAVVVEIRTKIAKEVVEEKIKVQMPMNDYQNPRSDMRGRQRLEMRC